MKLKRSKEILAIQASISGMKIDQIAKRFHVSPSTVDRIIARHRQEGADIKIKRGRHTKTFEPVAINDGELDSNYIDEVCAALLKTPFPYPEQLPRPRLDAEIERLRQFRMDLVETAIRPWSALGIRVCRSFFPNRFDATWKNSASASSSWRNERALRRAVRFQIRHGDPVTPHRVLRAITLICRTPTIFRPAAAKFIYERYCPKGGLVWDPCAGYGGRLLGAFVAGVRYVGTDVETETVDGNRQLSALLGSEAEVHLSPAEVFNPPQVDLVFTSPPYFDRERYSNEAAQSWRKHGASLNNWIEGFIVPVIARAFHALTANGALVLNIANLREEGAILPIVPMVIAAATRLDFHHAETLQMPLAAINRTLPSEPVLVFRKKAAAARF